MSDTTQKSKKQLLAEIKAEAMEETYNEITALRIQTLAALKDLDPEDILGSYKHSLVALVRKAGKDGISLADVKSVLPDVDILQQARNELGSEPYIIGKGTPNKRHAEGEKLIVEGKGQTKGNTTTLSPGENMKLAPKVDHNTVIEVESEVVAG